MLRDRKLALRALGKDRGSHYEVTLSGAISETSELLIDGIPAGRRVVIDAAGISGINSLGIRIWTNFMTGVCAISKAVVIRRLPPTMVAQAGMVKNFLASAHVESFFAPYCCEECGFEARELVPAYADVADQIPCRECGEAMYFDDLMESYLAFRADAESADTIPHVAEPSDESTRSTWL